MRKLLIYFLFTITFISDCTGQTTKDIKQNPASDIQQSYVAANVPDKNYFNIFLKRDLEKYFFRKYGQTTVRPELLREGATQSGVSYPKFYLWIKIFKDDRLLNEGAVRVEAIEKKIFEVTDFVSVGEIKNNSKDIYTVFPAPVCEKIKSRL